MSYTLQIRLPNTLYEKLTATARQTGQPLENIVTQWLSVAAEHVAADPLDAFIGAFDSGGSDWADNHDHYIGQLDTDVLKQKDT